MLSLCVNIQLERIIINTVLSNIEAWRLALGLYIDRLDV